MAKVKLIIAGSRHYWNLQAISKEVSKFVKPNEIVSGCAAGVDKMGEVYARQRSIPIKKFPANWSEHGRSAGPIRNRQMADYATHLIAFLAKGSRGTSDMIKAAKSKGLKIKVIHI